MAFETEFGIDIPDEEQKRSRPWRPVQKIERRRRRRDKCRSSFRALSAIFDRLRIAADSRVGRR